MKHVTGNGETARPKSTITQEQEDALAFQGILRVDRVIPSGARNLLRCFHGPETAAGADPSPTRCASGFGMTRLKWHTVVYTIFENGLALGFFLSLPASLRD